MLLRPPKRPLIMLGTVVMPWGEVVMIGNGGRTGERYYWLVDECGVVSMMPATAVESAWDRQRKPA